jgi:hypothetical protein
MYEYLSKAGSGEIFFGSEKITPDFTTYLMAGTCTPEWRIGWTREPPSATTPT